MSPGGSAVRGQKLFVRPIEPDDRGAVRTLLSPAETAEIPAIGLIGRLVGQTVAVAALSLTEDAIRIDQLVVAPELRRKRIGRLMVDEVESLARKLNRSWVVASPQAPIAAFLARIGFATEDDQLRRRVGRPGVGEGS
jgi:N-acetylglutamate synthase-like GNAT family acetyltransferase